MKTINIDINKNFQKAFELMEGTNKNVFITGKAGTGKSTLLDYFRNTTKKKVVVLAPTGVAAVNVQGQTIHSFFRFKPNVSLDKVKNLKIKGKNNIYKELDTIIIDEISMVRADLLDCVDKFLRLNRGKKKLHFGGVQMVFFGDLYQLPPVITREERKIFSNRYKTEYFYSAFVFENYEMELIELDKVYRQKDEKFIDILNAIRNNSITEDKFELLNTRYYPEFEPKEDDFYIYLTSRNDQAKRLNEKMLRGIKEELFTFEGYVDGGFEDYYLPTDKVLFVKKHSQVMLLNNDSYGRWVNGTVGRITKIKYAENKDDEDVIYVELANGKEMEVVRYKWNIFEYYYDNHTKSLKTETVGSFIQFPLKLAWAITIHKSQGKTFDNVIIDIGRGVFASGQVYVALSRCTSLDGIVLKQRIKKRHIFTDWRIVNFMTKYQYKQSDKKMPFDEKIKIIENAINNNLKLEIVYLKPNDEKSKRIIEPRYIGNLQYENKTFIGVEAYCFKRNDVRNFRVDRILSINEYMPSLH